MGDDPGRRGGGGRATERNDETEQDETAGGGVGQGGAAPLQGSGREEIGDRAAGEHGGRSGRVRTRGWIEVFTASFAPSALLGAQLAGLLFFLNPELPFAPGPLLRGFALYGGLLGVAGSVLHLPFLWGRPRRARRLLPWGLTVALALAATLDWTHASIYTYYLPPGINVRLLKTAFWLSVAAVAGFYTALLHSVHRRPYGRRSRIAFVVLVMFSLYITVERREAFRPSPPLSPLPSTAEPGQRRSLLVVGLEGATLEALLPMAEQGHIPFFARLLREGAYGRLDAFSPNHELTLWTTLGTGKYPYRHLVLGDRVYSADHLSPGAHLQVLPQGVGFRVWGLLGAEERSAAQSGLALRLWEILPLLGVPSGVVGWPGSPRVRAVEPGSPRVGREAVFALGERFFVNPLDASTVRPPELLTRGRLFRVRTDEIDPAVLTAFGGDPPPVLVDALAEDLWRESLFLFLLDQHPEVEAAVVHLPGLGEVSRAFFGGYAKAQFEGAQHRDYLTAAERLTRYYGHLDSFLAELWARRSADTLLVVVSAFGTAEPQGWRRVVTELAGGRPLEGYTENSPDGVLLLSGPGIAEGTLLSETELVDVLPTVAYGLGLPIARDLDGRILTDAFERGFLARHPMTFVPSYETLR